MGAGGGLPYHVAKHLGRDVPEPEAEYMSEMELPGTITALETAAYGEQEDSEDDPLDVPNPSRVMSGWVAARLMSEGVSMQLGSSMGPVQMPGGVDAINNALSKDSALQSMGLLPTDGLGLTFGWPRGAGLAVGMGPLRLDFKLTQRVSALAARKEETDKRFVKLRKAYAQALRDYHLEIREKTFALEVMRHQLTEARSILRPNRPTLLYATDAEEWAAVDRMVGASAAVVRQNVELRSRLALLTHRTSGCVGPDAVPPTAQDVFIGIQPGEKPVALGCATPPPDETSGAHPDCDPATGAEIYDPYKPRWRARPRFSHRDRIGVEIVLGLGDLVMTPYGRAVVIRQRDATPETVDENHPAFAAMPPSLVQGYLQKKVPCVEVLLQWGARAYINAKHVALLAVAGEEYTGSPILDKSYLVTNVQRIAGVLTDTKSEVEKDTTHAMDVDSVKPNAPASAGAATQSALLQIREPNSILTNLHSLGEQSASSALLNAEQAYEVESAMETVKNIRSSTGLPVGERVPVFRTSYERNGIERGIPLRIDPVRGSSALGYIVSTKLGPAGTYAAIADSERRKRNIVTPYGTGSGSPATAAPGIGNGGANGAKASLDAGMAALHGGMVPDEMMVSGAEPSGAEAAFDDFVAAHSGSQFSARLKDLRAYRAESTRLRSQMKQNEELIAEQRHRLSDSRQAISRLLNLLSHSRTKEVSLTAELEKREREIETLAEKLAEKMAAGTAAKESGLSSPEDVASGAVSKEARLSELLRSLAQYPPAQVTSTLRNLTSQAPAVHSLEDGLASLAAMQSKHSTQAEDDSINASISGTIASIHARRAARDKEKKSVPVSIPVPVNGATPVTPMAAASGGPGSLSRAGIAAGSAGRGKPNMRGALINSTTEEASETEEEGEELSQSAGVDTLGEIEEDGEGETESEALEDLEDDGDLEGGDIEGGDIEGEDGEADSAESDEHVAELLLARPGTTDTPLDQFLVEGDMGASDFEDSQQSTQASTQQKPRAAKGARAHASDPSKLGIGIGADTDAATGVGSNAVGSKRGRIDVPPANASGTAAATAAAGVVPPVVAAAVSPPGVHAGAFFNPLIHANAVPFLPPNVLQSDASGANALNLMQLLQQQQQQGGPIGQVPVAGPSGPALGGLRVQGVAPGVFPVAPAIGAEGMLIPDATAKLANLGGMDVIGSAMSALANVAQLPATAPVAAVAPGVPGVGVGGTDDGLEAGEGAAESYAQYYEEPKKLSERLMPLAGRTKRVKLNMRDEQGLETLAKDASFPSS